MTDCYTMARFWKDRELRTLILVNIASILENADESLLPGVYKEIGLAFNASPTALGSLTLLRSIIQAVCYPLAAYLAIRHDRARVIAFGALMWAAATLAVGLSSTFLMVALSRALNGVGLAVVIPSIQSLVADSTDESNRGRAFGWLQFTGSIGYICGGLLSVLLAGISPFGIAGWRVAFISLAFMSMIMGLLVNFYAVDPSFSGTQMTRYKTHGEKQDTSWGDLKELFAEVKHVIGIPTFQIIVAQGAVGSFPWAALSFTAMWLELVGFSHSQTAVLLGAFSVACSFGSLFGGIMGDILSTRLPNAGRIMLSQISSFSGLPLAAILFHLIHSDSSTALAHGAALFALGFFTSWNAPATNNPIFAEIVPEKHRTTIYALDRCFESILASFAPTTVGLLAQKFYGFVQTTSSSMEKQSEVDKKDAISVARALYTAYSIPLAMCCLIYTFLYWTYPKDRNKVLIAYAKVTEDVQLETLNENFDNQAKGSAEFTEFIETGKPHQIIMEAESEFMIPL